MLRYFIIIFVCSSLASAQPAPSWQWAKSYGNTEGESAWDICSDRFGFIYVLIGTMSDTLTIDSITLLTPPSTQNLFIAKFDSSGTVQWLHSITYNKYLNANLTIDQFDHLYVSGSFETDTLSIGNYTLINSDTSGTRDIFAAKFDLSGNLIWARRDGGMDEERIWGTSTDNEGNLYCTGNFLSDTFNFGSSVLTDTSVSDLFFFILKYDSLGNPLWAKQAIGAGEGWSCSNDQFGNVYVTGQFAQGSIAFDSITLYSPATQLPFFLVKYDLSGIFKWAFSPILKGGSETTRYPRVNISHNGYLYLTGSFACDTLILDSINLVNYSSNNRTDIFTAKCDLDGNVIWAYKDGGTDNEDIRKVFIDDYDNVFLTGIFFSFNFNFGSTVLTHSGSFYNSFFAKYDSSGNHLWAKQTQGSYSSAAAICANNEGDVYVCGGFDAASCTLDTFVLIGTGQADIFIAKLTESITVGENETAVSIPMLEHFTIMPNPTKDICTITFNNNSMCLLSLYDITGRRLQQQHFNGKTQFDVSTLANGIYIVEINNKDGLSVKGKLVKE